MAGQKFSNAEALIAGLQPKTISTEDNDLNINIQAEHEGDAEDEVTGFEQPETPVETQTEVTTTTVEDDIDEDTSSTPEAAELDASEAAADVEAKASDVDDVVEAAEGLESIALHLAQIAVEGITLNATEGQMIHNHVNYILRRFPLTAEKLNVPSVESWGETDNTAIVSMESVMDGARKAVQHGINLLKQIWTAILALFKEATSSGDIIRRKAMAVQKTVREKGTSFKPVEKVRIPAALSRPGLSEANIEALTKVLTVIGKTSYDNFTKTLIGQEVNAETVLKAASELDAQIEAAAGKTDTGLLGGFRVVKDGRFLAVKNVEGAKDAERPGFSASDITRLAVKNQALGKAIQDYKAGEAARKKVSDQIEAAFKAASTDKDQSKAAAKIRAVREALSAWSKRTTFETRLINKAIAVGNQVNNVLAASAKGGAAKEEKK